MSPTPRMTNTDTYSLRISPHPAGIRVAVTGESSFDNTVAYWRIIIAEVQARHPKGVLLIDELRGKPLSAEQWQSLVAAILGQGLESTLIAHVKPHGLQLIEHCEIYAQEAGFNARVFEDESVADMWLRHGEH